MPEKNVALITGASRGIGRATALRLADRYAIAAVARSEEDLASLRGEIEARGGTCRAVALDLADFAAVGPALEGLDVEVLVNNAGVGVLKPFLELTPAEWHRQVDVNFNALYYVTRAVLPGMVARGSGFIVNIDSLAGRNTFPRGSCYTATKHAMLAFAECLMQEVRDAGVRVGTIMPGSVATHFGGGREGRDTSWMLQAEDVAEAVARMLDWPAHALVSRVEMRPARPRRS